LPSPLEIPESKQLIGWQGLTVIVPHDWTVGSVTGDYREGYLRIDNADMPRLEVRWSNSKGADVAHTVKRYLASLERDRKQPQKVEVEPDSRFLSRRKVGKDQVQAYIWRGEQHGYGVGWYCKHCSRVILAQVLGKPGEKGLEELAVKVLATLDDHPADDWVTWSLYDLHTEIPADFEQTKVELRAGLTSLNFKRESETLTVCRWGMAEVALRGHSLESWSRLQLEKQFRSYHPHPAEYAFRGHEALQVTGESTQPLGLWIRLGKHVVRKEYADQLVAHLWHCTDTNRIYLVSGVLDVQNKHLIEQIRDRTRCHD
jgi:hypothetical protein